MEPHLGTNAQTAVDRVWKKMTYQADLDVSQDLIADEYVYRGLRGLEASGPEGFKRFISALHDSVHRHRGDDR